MTDIFVIYDDIAQVKKIEDSVEVSSIFHFIDALSKNGKKKAWEIKSHWAAKLDPFIIVMNKDKAIKAFYSETGEDVIEQLINYLRNEEKD